MSKKLIPFIVLALIACVVVTIGAVGAAQAWFGISRSESGRANPGETSIAVQPSKPTLSATELAGIPPGSNEGPAVSCMAPTSLTPDAGQKITFNAITFTLDPAVAKSVSVQECPEVPFQADQLPGSAHPSYTSFIFSTDRQRIENQPELRIYSISGDMSSYLYPLNSLGDLKNTLDQQPEPVTWFDTSVLHVQTAYANFKSGKGVRGMIEFAQTIFYYTNNALVYEYNGLTEDGRFYVNLRVPVTAPFLIDIENGDPATNKNPQAIAITGLGDPQQMQQSIETYNQEALRRFSEMKAEDASPSLKALDGLIGSLEIK